LLGDHDAFSVLLFSLTYPYLSHTKKTSRGEGATSATGSDTNQLKGYFMISAARQYTPDISVRQRLLLLDYRSHKRAFLCDLRDRIAIVQADLASSDPTVTDRQYQSIEKLQRKLAEMESCCGGAHV
jgi:hypothetical protein